MNETTLNASPVAESAGSTKIGGLNYKVAAILCYTPVLFIDVIAPIILLNTEPADNKKLRFHAIQGLCIAAAAFALGLANSMLMGLLIPLCGFEVIRLMATGSSLISLGFFAVCGYAIYCLVKNQDFRIPVLSDFAEKKA